MPDKGCHEVVLNDLHEDLYTVECDSCHGNLALDTYYLHHQSVEMPCPYCRAPLVIEEIE